MSVPKAGRSAMFATIAFMTIAVVCAAAAGMLLDDLLKGAFSDDPLAPVVVAKDNLPAGEPLLAEQLTVTHWPQSAIPENAFARVEDVLETGRIPLIPHVRAEAVLKSHLSRRHAGRGVGALLKPGERAMSISVDRPLAIARLIYPGAHVDVLVTVRRRGGRRRLALHDVTTRLVLQNVKALAVGEDIDPLTVARRQRANARGKIDGDEVFARNDSANSQEARAVVTLAVTPVQATQLTLAARDGKIDLALRSSGDNTIAEAPNATRHALLGLEQPTTASVAAAATRKKRRRRAKRFKRRPKRTASLLKINRP